MIEKVCRCSSTILYESVGGRASKEEDEEERREAAPIQESDGGSPRAHNRLTSRIRFRLLLAWLGLSSSCCDGLHLQTQMIEQKGM